MIILVTNNSTGNSINCVRKICSKFLFQISSDSYCGKISNDGLNLLVFELKKIALKNMSTQIYKFKRNRYEKLFHLGNSNNFSNELYSFKTKDITEETNFINYNNSEKILKYITIISGLFHDLGKNTVKFQEKLKNINSNKIDFIRHELISFIILKSMENCILLKLKETNPTLRKKDLTDKIIIKFFTIKENVINLFDNINDLTTITIDEIKNYYCISENMFKKNIIFSSILWLVLTHHKLSDNKITNDTIIDKDIFNEINCLNLLNEFQNITNEDLIKNLTIADTKEFLRDEYINLIVQNFNKINNILEKETTSDFEHIFYYIVYLSRPALINSDYMGSNEKEITSDFDIILANTKNSLPADRLTTHLIKVANYCKINFDLMYLNVLKSKDLHSISTENMNAKLIEELSVEENNFLGKTATFRWQQDVVNKILINSQKVPTFGVIIAETGTGKTRAIPKILTALNNQKIRYNLLLGLTTLTNQTYDEYCFLGMKKYVNCLIGGKLSENNSDLWKPDGTFNDVNKNYNFELIKKEIIKFNENNAFFSPKEKSILQKPIIIATIDHFILHGSLGRGSTTNLFLRTISSDLVLDEIDNYSNEQLNLISRLIFLMGLNGKNVIISSATTSNIIVENFYSIYKFGLEQYYKMKNNQNFEINLLLVSNYCSPSIIKTFQYSNFNFSELYLDFISNHLDKIKEKVIKQNIKILDMSVDNLKEAYDLIFSNCLNQHNQNFEEIDDKKISIGFVKFNLVENTIDFSKYLANKEVGNDSDLFIFCYHSKFILNDKEKNEKILNLLKRKNKKLNEIDYFKDIIKGSTKKNIVFIVVTSPIIEVGRDQDYDWAIIDPSTTEASVQAIGRVRRHRVEKYSNNNVLIFSKPISSVINSSFKQYYKTLLKHHSILNNYDDNLFNDTQYKFKEIKKESIDISNINNLLNGFLNEKIISNKYCLIFNENYNLNILKSCENIVQDIQLNDSNYKHYLCQNKYIYNNRMCLLSNKFINHLYFRDSKNKIIRLINDKYFIDEVDGIELANIKIINNDEKNLRFVINHFDFKQNKLNPYYQINLSNNDNGHNLFYSKIYGLIINKKIKNIFDF